MAIESTAGAEDTGGDGAWPLVVVGAGAAGLLAAVFAARRGARVLLLETRPRPGAKILVSGGGRCNVLPSNVTADEFETSGSPRTVRNLLGTWPRDDVHRFFEAELGVPLAVEAGGKVFPASGSARDVLAALLALVEHSGVRLEPAARVDRIARDESGAAPFVLEIADGRRVRAARIVLATGGRSLPKTGSDGAGYRFAAALGHDLVPPRPALVPLLDAAGEWGELAGVTLPVALEVRGEGRVLDRREGSFLFTHRGFSGPAVLDVSHHFTAPGGPDCELRVRWGGTEGPAWEERLRAGGPGTIVGRLRDHLPRRLADHLVARAGIAPDRRASELSAPDRARLVERLEAGRLAVGGHEGWRKAEVTAGGIRLDQVRPADLESRLVPGLHFAGEILDVTGRIGGYNFLWAWVTGRRAGIGAACAGGDSQGY